MVALLNLECIGFPALDIIIGSPGKGAILALVSDRLNILKLAGRSFTEKDGYGLGWMLALPDVNQNQTTSPTWLGSPPAHVRVMGFPASRGSLGQEVKDRGSTARPRVRNEAVAAMRAGEKYMAKEGRSGLEFNDSRLILQIKGVVLTIG